MSLDVVLQASQNLPLSYQIACTESRFCQDESIALIPKSPAEVFGEFIILPVITKITNVFHAMMSRISFPSLLPVVSAEPLSGSENRNKPRDLETCLEELQLKQQQYPGDHPNLANSYDNVGRSLDDLGRHKEALKYKQTAVEHMALVSLQGGSNDRGVYESDLASLYNSMGVTLSHLGDNVQALAYMQEALNLTERGLSPNNSKLASIHNNIGFALSNLGRHSEALECRQKALEVYKETLPPNSLKLATMYDSVALSLNDLERYAEALMHVQTALKIREKVLPLNHPDLVKSRQSVNILKPFIAQNNRANYA